MRYERALAIQCHAHRERREGRIPDVLLTVEHDPPVFTRGRGAGADGFIATEEETARAGIAVLDVDRGGDITYHGPGQVVAYPIVDLRRHGKDIHGYVERLEEAAIRTVAGYGISAARRPGYPGVWVGSEKIASIGVYVKDWTTRHGLALNVGVDPRHFAMIRPCGLPVRAVSINEFLASPVAVEDVEAVFAEELAEVFCWRLIGMTADRLGGEKDV
jgi:lipoate-protein ligase B